MRCMEPDPRPTRECLQSLADVDSFHMCLEAAFSTPHMQSGVGLGSNTTRSISHLLDHFLYLIHRAGVGSLQPSLDATFIPKIGSVGHCRSSRHDPALWMKCHLLAITAYTLLY